MVYEYDLIKPDNRDRFKVGYYYLTRANNDIMLFGVVEFFRGVFVIDEFKPGKGTKPLNLVGDEILMEMTHQQFNELYPEYAI